MEAERNRDVYIVQSTDDGETWSEPIRVNTAPQVRGQEGPAMAIRSAGVRDSVLIVWTDMRGSSTSVPADPMMEMTSAGASLRIGAVVDGRATIEIAPSLFGRPIIVTLVDVQGNVVRRLFDGPITAASLGIPLAASGLPTGSYFIHARCTDITATIPVVLAP